MVFGMGHLIGAWGLGKVWESKWKISKYGWFFLLLGGILPDSDFIFDWVFGLELHRTFFHSLLFVLFCCLIVYILLVFYQNHQKFLNIVRLK